MNPFKSFPQSKFEVVAPDGTVRSSGDGIFTGKQVVVFDSSLVVTAGDEIRRALPNGTEEAFEVRDPRYFDKFHGVDAHFQIDISPREP